ncbi:MAG: MFS transporter [Chloroflexi bacterium]|nr:MFS transporter [Chloroflexota bacterium]
MTSLSHQADPASSRYGWVIVIALSVTCTISFGILYYAFTVFIEPMQADLGWSKAEITGAYSLATLISGLVAAAIGRWIDNVGVRRLMTLGSIAATLLTLMWSSVISIPVFYLIWIGLGFAISAVFYEPAFALIFRWFTSRRSRPLTVLTFIAGFASVIFIPLSGTLVESLGWRSALVVLTLILAVTIPVHAFLLRDAVPESERSQIGAAPARKLPELEVHKRRDFWWLTIGFTLSMFVVSGMSVHLVPYLIGRGYAPAVAAGFGGAIGLVALPGRLIFTPLGARISRHVIAAMLFALQAIGLLALNLFGGDAGVWIFIVLYGAGFGAITPARAQLVAETFGAENYGTVSGRMTQIGALVRAAAPVAISVIFGIFSSYTFGIYLLAAVTLIGAFTILRAGQAGNRSEARVSSASA